MSACISMETSQSVTLLTDGAVYDHESTLIAIRRKVAISDKLPVAIATRGNMRYGDWVSRKILSVIEDYGFDASMAALANNMDIFRPLPGGEDRIEVVIAGVSETLGPRHMYFHNVDNYGEAGCVLKHPGASFIGAASNDNPDNLAAIGIEKPKPGQTPAQWCAAGGVQLMQFYREQAIPEGRWAKGQEPGYLVGGQLDLTVVTATGVTVKTIHRWPDQIGAKINPHAGKPKVTPIYPGMNRQQRRLMQSEQLKRRA